MWIFSSKVISQQILEVKLIMWVSQLKINKEKKWKGKVKDIRNSLKYIAFVISFKKINLNGVFRLIYTNNYYSNMFLF